MTAAYRWTIDKDYLEGTDSEHSAVGITGPRDASDEVKDNPQGFTLYDDDRNAYYHGWLYGDYEGDEPLVDFGIGYAGCTMLRFDGDENMTIA